MDFGCVDADENGGASDDEEGVVAEMAGIGIGEEDKGGEEKKEEEEESVAGESGIGVGGIRVGHVRVCGPWGMVHLFCEGGGGAADVGYCG